MNPKYSFLPIMILASITLSQNPLDNLLTDDITHFVIGTAADGIMQPRDLDFNNAPGREGELWVLNQGGESYMSDTFYSEAVCVPNNQNINFTIFDSYGDGICCSYGNGYYEVENCENVVADGGNFGSSESTNFNSGSCSNDGCGLSEVEITISILTDNWGGETSWTLAGSNNGEMYGLHAEPGGSTVTYFNLGTSEEYSEYRKDSFSGHFMHTASAIAFGENGHFANTLEVQDANNDPTGFFSGSTLWDSDLAIYAQINQNGPLLGSHIDMIHQSPFSVGIAWERDNVYWLFDGYHGAIYKYDFANPHGYGEDNHSDGLVYCYSQVQVGREPGISSHLVIEPETEMLYIADTGNQRILKLDINTGDIQNNLSPYGEPLAGYYNMLGADWDVIINSGLEKPSGIDVYDDRLLISDYETGDIIFYDLSLDPPEEMGRIATGNEGIMGIKIGEDFSIWYVNNSSNELVWISNSILLGDINYDELVNIQDILLIVNFITNTLEFTQSEFMIADMNSDSFINVLDVIMVVNLILGN